MTINKTYSLIANLQIGTLYFKQDELITVIASKGLSVTVHRHSTNEDVTVSKQALSFLTEPI